MADMQMAAQTAGGCSDAQGTLPACAPLANPYVPFQNDNPERYAAGRALMKGTLFPGLDLPYRGAQSVEPRSEEEMQRLHMLVDVSHLSDAGIWDILRVAKRPFVASHSNARACCPHVRNLTDEMLTAMGEKGCLIGLNYCASFLDTNPDRSQVRSRITDMARHARYIMDKAGEDCLALGSDFDGIGGQRELETAADMPLLAEALRREGFTEDEVEAIYWRNAYRFFKNNL